MDPLSEQAENKGRRPKKKFKKNQELPEREKSITVPSLDGPLFEVSGISTSEIFNGNPLRANNPTDLADDELTEVEEPEKPEPEESPKKKGHTSKKKEGLTKKEMKKLEELLTKTTFPQIKAIQQEVVEAYGKKRKAHKQNKSGSKKTSS
jgi:hypothetical protein